MKSLAAFVLSVLVTFSGTANAAGDAAGAKGAPVPSAGFLGTWEPMDTGMDGSISALAVYRNQLYAAGGFTEASGVPAQRIARWNGTAWEALPGGGADGGVLYLTVYRNWLVAAGSFDAIGGVEADGLARWDGSHWEAFDGNLFYTIDGLAVYGDALVVAGGSLASGPMEHIAKWDGTGWSALGAGVPDSVDAMGVVAGSLYAASDLATPPYDEAIHRWNGSAWAVFEDDIDDFVFAFGSYDNRLVAAGRFRSIGGVAADRVAAWNGSAWEPIASGVGNGFDNQRIDCLGNYNGWLWAGGYFEEIDGSPAGHIALTDGTAWVSPGTGADYTVSAFAGFEGALIVAGAFQTMDGQTVHFIARWRTDPVFGNGFDFPPA